MLYLGQYRRPGIGKKSRAGGRFFKFSDDLPLKFRRTMCSSKRAESEADVGEREKEDTPSSRPVADDPLGKVHCH